jgi:tetratricopeptide (TPR) repeat protein
MREYTANPDDLIRNPGKWMHDTRKGMDAFFDQGICTALADKFIEMWPDWRYRYLDPENEAVHIENVFKVIGDNHPCKALPRIYNYLFVCMDAEPELPKLQEIATEAAEYLERLAEYDQKYHVESWNPTEFEEHGLGDRFNSAKAAANEALSVCFREMGHYYTRLDDTPKAMEYYKNAVEAFNDDEALHALLKHLTDTGQYEIAKQYCTGVQYAYTEWTARECGDFRLMKIRSFVHFNLKEYDECIEVLTEILETEADEEGRNLLEKVIQERERAKQ